MFGDRFCLKFEKVGSRKNCYSKLCLAANGDAVSTLVSLQSSNYVFLKVEINLSRVRGMIEMLSPKRRIDSMLLCLK